MRNSVQNHSLEFQSQSVRSQNFSEDLSGQEVQSVSQVFQDDTYFSQIQSDPKTKKIHSQFLRSICIVFTVVIVVFFVLSILAYFLVTYLNKSHSEHQFDVETFESAHPLYNQTNLFFKVREKFRQGTPSVDFEFDRYEFNQSLNELVRYAPFYSLDQNTKEQYQGIKKTALIRATKLMELTHNVNFYGEFVFDHSNFYSSPKQKAHKFVELLAEERNYLNSKYQIDKYIHDQIRMCVFVPSYNNARSRLYLRNLDSIFQQNYKNYHVVYVNDASTDGTGDYVKAYMEQNQIPKEKYTIINNKESKLHCANIYMVAHNYCKEGEILVMLDGDDSLIGRDVFALLNAVYQKQKVALTYGQFLLIKKGNFISGGWSRPIPNKSLENGQIRNSRTFYSSHLKTMYVDLFRKIKDSDLKDKNGTFYGYSPDVAYITPAIEMVGTRLAFINEANYQYRFDTGLNEPSAQQISVTNEIYHKEPYQRLETIEFAENPKTIHYDVL